MPFAVWMALMLTLSTAHASKTRHLEQVDDGNLPYRPAVRYNNRKNPKRQPLKDLAEQELLASVGNAIAKRKKGQVELQPRVDTDEDSLWNAIGGMSMPNPSPSPVASSPPNDNGDGTIAPVQTPMPSPSPTAGNAPIAPVPPTPMPTISTGDSSVPSPAPNNRVTSSPTIAPTSPPTAEGNQAPPTEAPMDDRTLAPTRLEDIERPAESAASRSLVLGSSIGGALVLAGICFVFVVSCELRRGTP